MLLLSYTEATLNTAALVVGDVFAVHTTGGFYAKVLITSYTSGSLGLQYTTYGAASGGANAPMITAIENAATNIPPGLPNAAIAQGALFVVKGKNLGPANVVVASAFPLPTSIGGTSIQVTVGGTTVDAIMYYSLAGQIAAILPSRTPVGTGTLIVTYNGLASATAQIVVVAGNIGVFTLNTTGSGDAVATLPATNTVVSPSNAPNPGEIVTLWATGLGPVSGDESQPAQQADLTNIPLKVFIGGQPANVLFRGRNACCSGVDTIYVTVPQGLTGCANSVIMQIGNLVSNATSIPIGTNGRNCVPIAPNQTGGGLGSGTHSFGGLSLVRQSTSIAAIGPVPAQTMKMDLIGGVFEKVTTSGTSPQGSEVDIVSYGSCVVSTRVSGQPATPSTATVQYLDAGTITVSGPGITGSRQIAKSSPGAGILLYGLILDNTATTLAAGTYNFTGAGGPNVGSFTASYTMPPAFSLDESIQPRHHCAGERRNRYLDRRRPGGIRHHQRPEHSQWGHCGDLGHCLVHVYGPRDRWQLHDSTRSFARDAAHYRGSRRHLRRSGDPHCVSHRNHGNDDPSLRHRIRRYWKCVHFRQLGDVSVTSGQNPSGGVEPGVCSRRRGETDYRLALNSRRRDLPVDGRETTITATITACGSTACPAPNPAGCAGQR